MKSYLIIIPMLSLLTTACTEVIDIEVEDADKRLVIEATLTNTLLNNQVVLSQSAALYEAGTYTRISHAEVQIIDEQGQPTLFSESEPGVYTSPGFMGVPNQQYTLQVSHKSESYLGVSRLYNPVTIDSVSLDFRAATPVLEAGYVPTVYFSSDRAREDTYLRFLLFVNGEPLNQYDLYNGNQPRGEAGSIILFRSSFSSGDTLTILAASIDQAVYNYYYQLAELTGNGMGPAAAAPANPTTNLSNDALGYFGALGISSKEVIIP